MYKQNYVAPEVGTVKKYGDVTSVYVDAVGAEIVGSYELCKTDRVLRGTIQAKVMVPAVEKLNAFGKAEIVNGDRLMFVADLAKVGVEKNTVKDFVKKILDDLVKSAGVDVEFNIAESTSWINYVENTDGSYTISSSYGNALFNINGSLAAQRKSMRKSEQPAATVTTAPAPAKEMTKDEQFNDGLDKLAKALDPNA